MKFLLITFLMYMAFSCSSNFIPPAPIPETKVDMTAGIESNIKKDKAHRVCRALRAQPSLLHSTNNKGQSILHLAALRNRHELIESLIKAGIQLNAQDNDGDTALNMACYSRNFESIQLLIEAGADPTLKNNKGETAAHKAAVFCQKDAYVVLLPKAKFEEPDNSGKYPLHIASHYQNLPFVKALLRTKVDITKIDINGDDAIMACMKGLNSNPELEILLLSQKNIDANFKSKKNESYLHAAATNGKYGAVKKLLQLGANINATDNYDVTPLIRALRNRKQRTSELLISKGADLKVKNYDGRTLLHLMSFWMNEDTVLKQFINAVDVNSTDDKGRTALHDVVYWGHINNAQELIAAGANVNIKAKNGETCIFDAVKGKKYEMVELLIRQKADLGSLNVYNNTVLEAAISNPTESLSICKLILETGIDLKGKNIYDETILHTAVRNGNAKIVKLLLEYKADASIKDKFGKTPKDWSIERNLEDIIALFK